MREFSFYSNFAARDREAVLSQILHGGPLAEARARRNLSAYQNEIKPGKINVSLSDPCILILSREKASFSLSARFRSSLSLSLSLAHALCFSMNVSFHLVHSVSLCLRTALSSIHLRPKTQNKAIRAIRSAKRGPIIFRSADFARKNGHAITN